MKKLLLMMAVLAALYFGSEHPEVLRRFVERPATPETPGTPEPLATPVWMEPTPRGQPGKTFAAPKSGSQIKGEGRVTRLLADDNEGSRHQRFIVTLASGQTLLVAHNIDLAPRLASLKIGDTVAFHGVYEENPEGGVIHWTHRDPRGRHKAGWLKHAGRTYQ